MTVAVHDLRCEVRAPLAARRWTAECLRAHLDDDASAADLIDGLEEG